MLVTSVDNMVVSRKHVILLFSLLTVLITICVTYTLHFIITSLHTKPFSPEESKRTDQLKIYL